MLNNAVVIVMSLGMTWTRLSSADELHTAESNTTVVSGIVAVRGDPGIVSGAEFVDPKQAMRFAPFVNDRLLLKDVIVWVVEEQETESDERTTHLSGRTVYVKQDKNGQLTPRISLLTAGQSVEFRTDNTKGMILGLLDIPKSDVRWCGPGQTIRFGPLMETPLPRPLRDYVNERPTVAGWVFVTPTACHATTAADGTFRIQLTAPRREITIIQFWHEEIGYLKNVTVGGKRRQLPKGQLQVRTRRLAVDLGTIQVGIGRIPQGHKTRPNESSAEYH